MSEQTKAQELIEKYQALETRHRFMVLGMFAVILLLLFDLFWFTPQETKQKQLKRQIATIEKKHQDLANSIQQRNQELMGTAFNKKRQQIEALKKQEEQLDQELSRYAQLVSPRQMPGLLRDFFNKSKTLKLKGLTKHEVKPAFKSIKVDSATQKQAAAATGNQRATPVDSISFYRHEFTVTLRGKYFDLAESLKALEAMDIKIYWDSLKYQVDKYPYADIQLTVYTFSYDKNWIGV